MYRYKIELVTYSDLLEFVKIAGQEKGAVKLLDGNGMCVNGKSILGAMASVEWASLYCESENDIYQQISKFCD